MQLILSGNPNLDSLLKVVYIAYQYYNKQINEVIFIDNLSSDKNEKGEITYSGSLYDRDGSSIESIRNQTVRGYINNVKIESILIEKNNLNHDIPRIISDNLKTHNRSQIVVDLTSGDKYISSTLYASASLSQVENLFFLTVSRDKFKTLPEDLTESDYKVETISPLRNIEAIGKYAFFEILYFKNRINEITLALGEFNFKSNFLRNQLTHQLESCIDSYFLENYSDSIAKIGQIIEELSIELPDRIKNLAAGQIKKSYDKKKDFDESITWLRVNFCDPLRGKRNQDLLDYEENLKDLQTIDKLFDVVKVYRNVSSHPYDFLRGRDEAGLVIKTSLYILDQIIQSGVLRA